MFEYSSESERERICSLKQAILQRVVDALKAAWQSGKDLVEIRQSLSYGKFTEWLKSDEWPLSPSWAYKIIKIYEGSEDNGFSEAIQGDLLQISPTAFRALLKPERKVALVKVRNAIPHQVVNAEFLKHLKQDNIDAEEKTGCYSCIYYIRKYGRERCQLADENISQLGFEAQVGCANLQTKTNQSGDKASLELPPIVWSKVTTAASKEGIPPETYISNFLLDGLDKIQQLECLVAELTAERDRLALARNIQLTESRKAS